MRNQLNSLFLAALACALPLGARAQTDVHEQAAQAYRVEVPEGALHLKAGAQSQARVAVVPKAGAHVSPDAPISFKLSAGKSIELAKAKLGRPDAKETEAKGVEFQIPFTGKAAGRDEIKGTLSFFICTAQLCEQQKKDVSLAVVVE